MVFLVLPVVMACLLAHPLLLLRHPQNLSKTKLPKKFWEKQNQKKLARKSLKVANFQSIKNKAPDPAVCLETHNPDIIIGSESWLNPNIQNSEIFPDNFTVIRKDRENSNGGVFVAVKNDLGCAHRQDLDSNCEIVWVQIQLAGSKVLNIGAFHRPPNVTDPKYLEELRDSLSKIKNSHKGHIWLGGDFNFGGIDWPSKSSIPMAPNKTMCHKFIDMMDDYNLEQEVREPTRKDKILDLFFTNNSTLVEKSTVIPGLSDHDGIAMITVCLSPHICHQKPHKVVLYKKKKGDMEGMRKELNDFCETFPLKDTNQSDVESLWCQFKTKLLETIMDTHIPSKLVSSKNKQPWINTTVQRSLRKKNSGLSIEPRKARTRLTGNPSERKERTHTKKLEMPIGATLERFVLNLTKISGLLWKS